MSKKFEKPRAERRQADLDALIARAARQPGVAEVLALHEKYQERLTEIQVRSGRPRAIGFTTSDSTS